MDVCFSAMRVFRFYYEITPFSGLGEIGVVLEDLVLIYVYFPFLLYGYPNIEYINHVK